MLTMLAQISFTVYVIVALQSILHGNGQRNEDIAEGDLPIAMHVCKIPVSLSDSSSLY